VLHTLEAALWAFARTNTFEDGAILAVNLGEDADTTGAVYGQLAGAFYGYDGIPAKWRAVVARHGDIISLADRLYQAALTEEVG
jgi:ADP-ribosylglycohydrolase